MPALIRLATGFLLVVVALASAAAAFACELRQSGHCQSPIPQPAVAESRHPDGGICRGGVPCEAAVLRESQVKTFAKGGAGESNGVFSRANSRRDTEAASRFQTARQEPATGRGPRIHLLYCSWLM
jgi:hypothetical protein